MDRPLRLAAWITFHLAICKGAGFLGTEVAFLLTLGQPRPWLRSFSSACSLSSEASTLSQRLPRPLRSGGFSVRAIKGQSMTGWGFVEQVSYDLKQPESVQDRSNGSGQVP